LEDTDMRMIANLVQAADKLGLVYDQESMVYLEPSPKRGRPRKEE